ncbi:unnamed protein product [Albugo candida]|uniref:Uncharacterized protein n=1 Tax=Albugo candida TaxID=65357 RepID=A0A024GUI6_9STRA|nr:unnamed protein product [Albugo candida]|eukprot:CCI50631.1 unnamed protein product [Albugo candida]
MGRRGSAGFRRGFQGSVGDITSLDQDDMALAAIGQIHFQLRVLDRLQVYLSRGSKQSFMLLIVPPLVDQLHAAERGIKHEKVCHERIRILFKIIHSRANMFIYLDSALKRKSSW